MGPIIARERATPGWWRHREHAGRRVPSGRGDARRNERWAVELAAPRPRKHQFPQLIILPSTNSFFTPRDIFGSIAMAKLLHEWRAEFDLVVLDAPPVLGAIETRIISAQVDQTIIVTRWNNTPAKAVRKAIALLESADGVVSGVALNYVNPNSLGRLTARRYDLPGKLRQAVLPVLNPKP